MTVAPRGNSIVYSSPEAADYTPQGSPTEHCSICRHWRPGWPPAVGACEIVTGTIAAGGWCRYFTHESETPD